MKKKTVTFFTSLVFALCLGGGLAACGDKNEAPKLSDWWNDSNYHWRYDDNDVMVDYGKHDWQVNETEETQTCTVCGLSEEYVWLDEPVDGVTYSKSYNEYGGAVICATVEEGAVTVQILSEYRNSPVRIVEIRSSTVKEVAIPKDVKEIYVFDDAKELEKITVEEGNSYYSSVDGILYNKQKTLIYHVPNRLKGTVHIPDSITSLEGFEYCFGNVEAFYTGNGITELNNDYRFNSLRELHLGKKVKVADGILGRAETVTVDSANPYYIAEEDVLYTKDKTRVLFISNAMRKLTLPESVTYIDSFGGGNNLVQLTILSTNFNIASRITANKLCEIYAPALGYRLNVEGYYSRSYVLHGSLDEPSVLDEREDGTVWFTGTEKKYLVDYSGKESEFVLPDAYNGQAYTVGSYAFTRNETLESVTIPSGVPVDEYAFTNCKNLKKAVVGGDLGKAAFSNCTALVDVELKSGVKLNSNPFENCPAVEYENGVGYVGNWAVSLENATKKIKVEIREGTVGLVEDIFPRPQNIEAISLPDGVLFVPTNMEELPDSVFEIYENGKYLNEWLLGMVDRTATELVVREGTTGISFNAFEIPLNKITFPQTLKKFSLYSASDSARSAQVDFKGDLYDWWALEEFGDSALKTQFWRNVKVNGTLLSEITEFTVKEGIEIIPENAFIQCENLQRLVLPEGVKTIENNAIYSFELEELYLPASLENVAADAFVFKRENELILKIYYADTVEQLFAIDSIRTAEWRVLPYGELYINDAKVTELTVPNGVQDINFTNFIFKDAELAITEENSYYAAQSGIVYNKAMTEFVYIPQNVSGEIVIPEGITKIPNYAFSSNVDITGVRLPSTLRVIGENAFYGTSIQEVSIPTGVTDLGNFAFGSCQQLVFATVPETLDFNREKVFYYCPNLLGESYGNAYYLGRYFLKPVNTEISWARIKEGVTEIPAGAFRDCAKLLRIYVPSSVNYIGSEAFYGCSQYLGLYFEATNPDGVITEAENARLLGYGDNGSIMLTNFNKMPIGLQISEEGLAYAHEMNWELTGVADYTTIIYGYFNDAETLTVPSQLGGNDVYMIYANAFMGNTALKTLTIEKCTVIGSYAFAECSELTSVTLPVGTAQKQLQIGTYAFYNCAKLGKTKIPANVAFIGAYAFDGCKNLLQATTDTVLSVWSYDSATGECTREKQYAAGQDVCDISTTYARFFVFNGSYTETEVKSIYDQYIKQSR